MTTTSSHNQQLDSQINIYRCNDLGSVDQLLDVIDEQNTNISWNKLDKTIKFKLLSNYANSLEEPSDKKTILINFFKNCLDQKKIHKVKDVQYDKINGIVTGVSGLYYNKLTNAYTIKNIDKHVSTLKNLGPKKKSTIRNNE